MTLDQAMEYADKHGYIILGVDGRGLRVLDRTMKVAHIPYKKSEEEDEEETEEGE